MALWWLGEALPGLWAWLPPPASGGCPKVQSSRIHRRWPVRVKAAQKHGFEYSFECSRDNCAFRQASARGSPERQRRLNSVINPAGGLVAHFPKARQHGLRPGDAEGPPQGHHALANLHFARPAVAGPQDDQLRSEEH